MDNKPLTKQV